MKLANSILTFRQRPTAAAVIKGSSAYPQVNGTVNFYQTSRGVIVSAEVSGLPSPEDGCENPVFAFHIHASGSCTGTTEDPFADAGPHYNPHDCPHPQHAGDMPPLFGNRGFALLIFFTDRFCVRDIIGRTVIIHSGPDDFTSQPAGNAGKKIACGEIKYCRQLICP